MKIKKHREKVLHLELDQNRSIIEQKLTGQQELSENPGQYIECNPQIDQDIFSEWAKNIYLIYPAAEWPHFSDRGGGLLWV